MSQNTDQYLISIGLLLIHWILNVGIFILLFSTKNMLFDSDLRVIRILYLTKPDIEHLQTYKLNSTILPSLFPDSYKKLILMFPNIFASMVTVTIDNFKVWWQVTSTLNAMKQWNLYFSFLMVFTGRESINSLWDLWRTRGRGNPRLASLNNFGLLVIILSPHWCKTSGPYLKPVSNYWILTKTAAQKDWFFGSNPYKIYKIK